jgi:hypothetical protein
MGTSLDRLLQEADDLIEKRASKVAPIELNADEDINQLASFLMGGEKVASVKEEPALVDTPFEKIARAIAILEAAISINDMERVSKFEKVAMDNGYSDEQVTAFLSEKELLPIHRLVGWTC